MNRVEKAKALGEEGEKLLAELMTYQLTDSELNYCNLYLMEMAKGLVGIDISADGSDKELERYLKKTETFNKELQKMLDGKKK